MQCIEELKKKRVEYVLLHLLTIFYDQSIFEQIGFGKMMGQI